MGTVNGDLKKSQMRDVQVDENDGKSFKTTFVSRGFSVVSPRLR